MVSTPQVIEMVGGLADRPIIRMIFDNKLPTLVAMCGQEIDEVKVIFDRYIKIHAWALVTHIIYDSPGA